MQLNPDCVRDILIYAEEFADPDNPWVVSGEINLQVPLYPARESLAHVQMCINAGYLILGNDWIDGSKEINGLTFSGHQALSSIRNPSVHETTKQKWLSGILSGAVSSSISGFFSLAAEIARNALLS